jgi:serine/threonine-protein kinase
MEYVAGEALSRLMKVSIAKGVLASPRVAATILSSVLHGLHAAHHTKDEHGGELGIVHRDVSPQNILVGVDGAARVLDFGVAKAAGRLQTTREGQVKGKIAYMPPEQLGGAAVTKQVDVYAASVVLWEMLTGRRLFDGETEAIVLARALDGSVEPPSAYNPHVEPAVDAVVLRGLSRDPARRFATARDMAMAIERTIGLASPSEVGEWVELVAGYELAQRAQTVAAIEVASLSLASLDPKIGLATAPSSDVHSQVSSISVSRPAISIAPPRRFAAAKLMVTIFAVLAVLGGSLGVLTMRDVLSPARHPEPHRVAGEAKRRLEVVVPADAAARVVTEKEKEPPVAAVVRPPPPPPVVRKPAVNPCDPPFILDANGHKKYKTECFK